MKEIDTLGISVVIRTRDKERHFEHLMKYLAKQTTQPAEIIVVDNYSSKKKLKILRDGLKEAAEKCFPQGIGLELITITDDEFSHAFSTNLGVSAAENELVCITNAHSLPTSTHWLQNGIKHFRDPKTAGVGGFFIPHRGESALDIFYAMTYFLSQMTVLRQNRFCTVNCIIRKSLWKKYPFDENLPELFPETKRYGLEDYDWSEEMIARNFKIIMDPSFSVFHSHEKGFAEILRNVRNYFVYKRIQRKIDLFSRPRESLSKVLPATDYVQSIEISK
jgi:glycosyltransferase involved in cell wall biosynthesis